MGWAFRGYVHRSNTQGGEVTVVIKVSRQYYSQITDMVADDGTMLAFIVHTETEVEQLGQQGGDHGTE